MFIVICSVYYLIGSITLPWKQIESLTPIPIIVALVSAPLSGWLADTKFGNYKVFRFGAILLFVSAVTNCLLLILEALFWESNNMLIWIHFSLASSLYVVGVCASMITALPLGLDQMPDASSSSIASYIAWFVCTFFVTNILGKSIDIFINTCKDERMKISYRLLSALFLTIFTSIVLFSMFLCSPKWLIIEPKSPQSLKTMYQVFKFAVKNKAPLNRSAFTYWEEDIPSRIDLGKSKYGGPFTTEQVENVKTTLRLVVITLTFFFGSFFFFLPTYFYHKIFQDTIGCTNKMFQFWVTNSNGYGFLGTLTYEFLVYPLFKNKLSGILKRIRAAFLIVTLVCFVCFALKLAQFFSMSNDDTTEWIVTVLYYSVTGLLQQVLLTSILEFMCAQSPYNMRGLLLSLVVPLLIITSTLASTIGHYFFIETCSTEPWCFLILTSVKIVLCLIGFLLFCVVARWYKKRVRDENYNTQQVVEEVYDRYLTAAESHSASYGTISS